MTRVLRAAEFALGILALGAIAVAEVIEARHRRA